MQFIEEDDPHFSDLHLPLFQAAVAHLLIRCARVVLSYLPLPNRLPFNVQRRAPSLRIIFCTLSLPHINVSLFDCSTAGHSFPIVHSPLPSFVRCGGNRLCPRALGVFFFSMLYTFCHALSLSVLLVPCLFLHFTPAFSSHLRVR